MVQRAQQLAIGKAAHTVEHGEEDVEVGLAAGELRDRLVHRVEGRDLDLHAVLFAELLDLLLPDVLGPVVDLERPRLRLEPGSDQRVVVVDGERDRAVGPREREGEAGLFGRCGRTAGLGRRRRARLVPRGSRRRRRRRRRSGRPGRRSPGQVAAAGEQRTQA